MRRTRTRALALLGLVLALGGCNLIPVKEDDLDSQIETWVGDKAYGRAIDALTRIDPKNPRYPHFAERRRQVEALAADYERETVAQARKELARGNWAAALDRYDAALERLPKSTVLRDGLAELHQEQSTAVAREELDLLIARARWLRDTLSDVEAIARIAPRDRDAQRRLADHREQIDAAARRLAGLGAAAFRAGDYRAAERALPLAVELSAAEEVKQPYAELKAWAGERQARKQAARDQRLKETQAREAAAKRRFQTAMKAYRAAVDKGELRAALDLLGKLDEMAPDDAALAEERTRLSGALQEETLRLYETGVSLYSRGEFEQAVEVWRRATRLNPDHRETRENLERAERVIEKLQQLRDKQAVDGSGT
jgi:tetratricopeptide (TPR) repeat protein